MLNLIGQRYPTPDEIMARPVDFRNDTLEAVLKWKNEFFSGWSTIDHDERLNRLEELVYRLAKVYGLSINVDRYNDHYAYDPRRQTIMFDGRYASIISTLHEFRHALNGPDETSACRWSVHLFKQCFPKQFEKLEFKPGTHLLVKKPA